MNGTERMAMKRWMRTAVGTVLAVALAACGEAADPIQVRSDTVVPAPQEMTLRVGEEAPVANSVVKVQFARVVEDSRCPMDAVCVWEGNAVVEVGIRMGMGPTHPLQMNTTLEPRSVVWNGVRVTLLDLQPYPMASKPTPGNAYTARIRVEQAR